MQAEIEALMLVPRAVVAGITTRVSTVEGHHSANHRHRDALHHLCAGAVARHDREETRHDRDGHHLHTRSTAPAVTAQPTPVASGPRLGATPAGSRRAAELRSSNKRARPVEIRAVLEDDAVDEAGRPSLGERSFGPMPAVRFRSNLQSKINRCSSPPRNVRLYAQGHTVFVLR
jgi:hypothetical protein